MQEYTQEVYDSKAMLDSDLLIRSYAPEHLGCTLLLECAWFGEIDTFSPWDQPSLPYVLDKLHMWSHVNVLPSDSRAGLVERRAHRLSDEQDSRDDSEEDSGDEGSPAIEV